jgi:hypothetical protein
MQPTGRARSQFRHRIGALDVSDRGRPRDLINDFVQQLRISQKKAFLIEIIFCGP